jgi:hypothetical protein
MGSLSRLSGRRLAVWAALALGWMLPSTGCQVEYAGMTLPSGKYMHDDVQYFAPGPSFPWANTNAATQRARMQAMGIAVPPPGQTGPFTMPPGAGALSPLQRGGARPTDVNASPLTDMAPIPEAPTPPAVPVPEPPAAGVVPPPGP